MTSQQTGRLSPSRRTLVKGAAWSVPVVAMAAPAHAVGASQCITWFFGEGSYKCPGQSTDFAFGYGLTFCVTNTCPTGGPCVTFRIRLDLPVTTNSGAVLVPRSGSYENPVIEVCPGETECAPILYEFSSDNSASKISFYVEVNGGDPVLVTTQAPPQGCP